MLLSSQRGVGRGRQVGMVAPGKENGREDPRGLQGGASVVTGVAGQLAGCARLACVRSWAEPCAQMAGMQHQGWLKGSFVGDRLGWSKRRDGLPSFRWGQQGVRDAGGWKKGATGCQHGSTSMTGDGICGRSSRMERGTWASAMKRAGGMGWRVSRAGWALAARPRDERRLAVELMHMRPQQAEPRSVRLKRG